MRIPLSCMKCIPFGDSANFDPSKIKLYFAELQDNGLYYLECSSGHKTATFLQESLFEILFDLGANAILDGYYREAISSFTSSMERFFEFYIAVISESNNIPESVFSETWKKVAAQSERQYGAYIFVYMMQNSSAPTLLPEGLTKLRNEVIHKGKIPSKDNAIKYGQSILDIIAPTMTQLKINYGAEINIILNRRHQAARRELQQVENIAFMSTNTIIRNSEIDLTKALTRIASQRKTITEAFPT